METGLDGDDGILELEEVDNVEVVYEEEDGGKVIKFNVRSRSLQLLQLLKCVRTCGRSYGFRRLANRPLRVVNLLLS